MGPKLSVSISAVQCPDSLHLTQNIRSPLILILKRTPNPET